MAINFSLLLLTRQLLLLSFTSLSLARTIEATTPFKVTRKDEGDHFTWYGEQVDCAKFSNNTASYEHNSCQCQALTTFSTDSNTCQLFNDQGKHI